MSLVFLYVVCNKHFNKLAKNQTWSRVVPEIMAKKRSRGHPNFDLGTGVKKCNLFKYFSESLHFGFKVSQLDFLVNPKHRWKLHSQFQQ